MEAAERARSLTDMSAPSDPSQSSSPLPVTTLHLAHTPADQHVSIAHFTGLRNASQLRTHILTATSMSTSSSESATPPSANALTSVAMLDAALVLSPTHLLTAIFRALHTPAHRRKTRNIASEMMFCLGHTNNIASTLRDFGVSEATQDLVVVAVGSATAGSPSPPADAVAQSVLPLIQADGHVAFSEHSCRASADVQRIRKMYRLTSNGANAKASPSSYGQVQGAAEGKKKRDAAAEKKARREERVKERSNGVAASTDSTGNMADGTGTVSSGIPADMVTEHASRVAEIKNRTQDDGEAMTGSNIGELEVQILGLMALRGAT